MRLAFTKMHGLGNDFIVFDAAGAASVPSAAEFRRLADRRTGIGFDQALVLEPPRRDGTDVYYRIFNADGSEVEQCGNGARCIARLVASRRHATLERPLVMDSPGGIVNARLRPDGLVSVAMGVPDFQPASLPFEAPAIAATYHLDTSAGPVEIAAVSIGNPHAVIRVRDVERAPVDTVGPAVENHPRFPRRVNVGFLEIVAPDHVRLRVFERGVGETQACGTGACAAVAVGRQHGPLAEEVTVDVPGGRMIVRWPGPGEQVWLTGPAETAFEGHVDVAGA
ncbi:MAG TPA: diaminopimelate epimerase [Steroidobacteraceae bacterium]|jgi:diaminopimelate epimerase|nr:diaminopimelate epimerase [Steroidobacteraceae bacterium]